MQQGRILIVTGSPGTGKTTAAALVAQQTSLEKSVHMHTDDFYHYLSKGYIAPHLPASNGQNRVVIEAFLEAAKRFARGGYDVVVDGIVGPWFLQPWKQAAREGYEVHYIVLRASREETLKRATGRAKLNRETNIELVETMWEQFADLGEYERNAIDTTHLTIRDTVSAIQKKVAEENGAALARTRRKRRRPHPCKTTSLTAGWTANSATPISPRFTTIRRCGKRPPNSGRS